MKKCIITILMFTAFIGCMSEDGGISGVSAGSSCSTPNEYICNADNTSVLRCDAGVWTVFEDCNFTITGDVCIDNTTQQPYCGKPSSGDTGSDTGADTGNTGADTGNTGADTGNTGADTGNTGADTGNTGADTGNTGADTGNTGADTGNTGADTGNTGNTGNTGADTGDTGNTGDTGECGNGILDTGETCDPDMENNGGVDCSKAGDFQPVTIAPCNDTCDGYDTSVCENDYPSGVTITGTVNLYHPTNVDPYGEPDFTKSEVDGGLDMTACPVQGSIGTNGDYGSVSINLTAPVIGNEPPSGIKTSDPFLIEEHFYSGSMGDISLPPISTDGAVSLFFESTNSTTGNEYVNFYDHKLDGSSLSNDYVLLLLLEHPLPTSGAKIGFHTGCHGNLFLMKFDDTSGDLSCYYAVGVADSDMFGGQPDLSVSY